MALQYRRICIAPRNPCQVPKLLLSAAPTVWMHEANNLTNDLLTSSITR